MRRKNVHAGRSALCFPTSTDVSGCLKHTSFFEKDGIKEVTAEKLIFLTKKAIYK